MYADDNQYEELRTLAAVELQLRVTKLLHYSPESFAIKIKIDKNEVVQVDSAGHRILIQCYEKARFGLAREILRNVEEDGHDPI